MSEIGRFQDGLDVSTPNETTPEEVAANRAIYTGTNKGLLDSFEFWLEFRPDVLKRHKARRFRTTSGPDHPLVGLLGALHQYTILAFREGVAYEIRHAQAVGATRADIIDTMSVAWMHSGHRGRCSRTCCSTTTSCAASGRASARTLFSDARSE